MRLFNKEGFIKVKVEKFIDGNEPNREGCVTSDKMTK